MFNKLNLYTLVTFVVYPVFFIGAIIFFLFINGKNDEPSFLKRNNLIKTEIQEIHEDKGSKDVREVTDSLSYTDDNRESHIRER